MYCNLINECSSSKRKRKFARLQEIGTYTKLIQVFSHLDDRNTCIKDGVRLEDATIAVICCFLSTEETCYNIQR
jgi:hypothetical protein